MTLVQADIFVIILTDFKNQGQLKTCGIVSDTWDHKKISYCNKSGGTVIQKLLIFIVCWSCLFHIQNLHLN